jgi:Rrf2 family protein
MPLSDSDGRTHATKEGNMFKISTKTRYGIWALIELARATNAGPVNLHTIARKKRLSYKYLESIFTLLRKADLVRSTRGPEGGYELVKNARELSMLDIVMSLEGPISSVTCIHDPGACGRSNECSMRDFFSGMDEKLIDYLRSKKLDWFTDGARRRERSVR